MLGQPPGGREPLADEQAALAQGMAEKAAEFKAAGAEVYRVE